MKLKYSTPKSFYIGSKLIHIIQRFEVRESIFTSTICLFLIWKVGYKLDPQFPSESENLTK